MIQAPTPRANRSRDKESHDNSPQEETSIPLEGDTSGQTPLQQEEEKNVATATHSLFSGSIAGQEGPLPDPEHLPPPSEEQVSSVGVDRFNPVMIPLRHKSSRKLLFIDVPDMKTNEDELITIAGDEISPSTLQHRLRTIRRKKHLNVLQTSSADAVAPEAIPISLTLRPSASKASLKAITPRTLSQQISIVTDSTDSPITPSIKPELSTPSTSPEDPSESPTSTRSVRLGHPSRPYYSAIRKGGISPSSSRPTSGLSSSPPSRRQSTPSPASPLPATSRRLSMSTMFYSPGYSQPAVNALSVFALPDDEDANDANDTETPVLPPTPAPGAARFSFSLPRRAKERPLSHGEQHAHTVSYARSAGRGYRGSGVGFSMSGQTELRMALAEDAASAGITEDGFRFRATPLVPPVSDESDRREGGSGAVGVGADAASGGSFMGRVRRLRRGLKDMLFMT
ncbi:hypothetical protein HYPSUDRAFT_55998 [Hypholoma sublateritium FD-334 SS-4]|uniref:Uncharacterized protein n=1 Tax=Hypholoma sublateritium (strain FD-334 SS-4) TaxID=945553 RepID=A0A0D2L1E8_HYPSF|nr:hypothetical protein HYPSUDRAFT_55998 [Hypholoma sublateritium FD-334 SS-4]